MDYLPFIDDVRTNEEYRAEVESRINSELHAINPERNTHPDVIRLLNYNKRLPSIFDEKLYRDYQELDSKNDGDSRKQKRPSDEDALLIQHKRKYPRIELTRYDLEDCGSDKERLATVDNYLKHQELILQELLPKTLLNQWAINNDFLQHSVENVKHINSNQEEQIRNINEYRRKMQLQNKPFFDTAVKQWKEKLIDNLNVQ